MVYGDLIHNEIERSRFIEEEIGLTEKELPERIVVSPLPFEKVLPQNFEKFFRELGAEVEKIDIGDHILQKLDKNRIVRLDKREILLAFLGRGTVEFADRIRILSIVPHVKEFLFIGTAASLDSDVVTGDLNIPRVALPVENTSELFVDVTRAVPVADVSLWKEILKVAVKTEVKVHTKLHATLPFFYMETREFLEFLRECGVATIDMEISALYRIARHYGKKTSAVVRVSDMPLEGLHFLSESFISIKKEKINKAQKALLKIIEGFLLKQ